MKKYLLVLVAAVFVSAFTWKALDVLLAPDGIQIGPSSVLPIKEFDEYVFEMDAEAFAPGQIKTLNFGSDVTFHGGASCSAEVLNPGSDTGLLIRHVWFDGDVKVMVQNTDSSSQEYTDQVDVTCWNTANFMVRPIK